VAYSSTAELHSQGQGHSYCGPCLHHTCWEHQRCSSPVLAGYFKIPVSPYSEPPQGDGDSSEVFHHVCQAAHEATEPSWVWEHESHLMTPGWLPHVAILKDTLPPCPDVKSPVPKPRLILYFWTWETPPIRRSQGQLPQTSLNSRNFAL
jgi:hypothetical protein